MSQTTRAHRLCQKAYKQGGQKLQLPLFLAIFKAYLQEGKDIADIDLLSDLAAEIDIMSKEQVAFYFYFSAGELLNVDPQIALLTFFFLSLSIGRRIFGISRARKGN